MESLWPDISNEASQHDDFFDDDEIIHLCESLDSLHRSQSVPEGGLGQQTPRDNTTKSRPLKCRIFGFGTFLCLLLLGNTHTAYLYLVYLFCLELFEKAATHAPHSSTMP